MVAISRAFVNSVACWPAGVRACEPVCVCVCVGGRGQVILCPCPSDLFCWFDWKQVSKSYISCNFYGVFQVGLH